jgi:hypothetical protein
MTLNERQVARYDKLTAHGLPKELTFIRAHIVENFSQLLPHRATCEEVEPCWRIPAQAAERAG